MPDWLAEAIYWGVLIVLETSLAGLVWFKVGTWVEASEAAKRAPPTDTDTDSDDDAEGIRDDIRALTEAIQGLREDLAQQPPRRSRKASS